MKRQPKPEFKIAVVEVSETWELEHDFDPLCEWSPMFWSTERVWGYLGYHAMKFESREAAEQYVRVHRKKLEEAEQQP
jgi:hypothetical protein